MGGKPALRHSSRSHIRRETSSADQRSRGGYGAPFGSGTISTAGTAAESDSEQRSRASERDRSVPVPPELEGGTDASRLRVASRNGRPRRPRVDRRSVAR